MKQVFLGRPIHWGLAMILVAGGAALGQYRLHVIDFNLFIILLLCAVVALLALVLRTSSGDVAVTRDPINAPSDADEEAVD